MISIHRSVRIPPLLFKNRIFPRFQCRPFATKFPIVEDPKSYKLLFNDFIDPLSWKLGQPLTQKEIHRQTDILLKNNPNQRIGELFFKRFWDIEIFNQENYPIIISLLDDMEVFSTRGERYFLFMDMPIRMPGKDWKIPDELKQFQEPITKAIRFEKLVNPNFDYCFVYLTVDQRPVSPGESQRRTGYHSDSYINIETCLDMGDQASLETDSIYLAYDSIPTEFCGGPFPFEELNPNDTQMVLNHFEKIGSKKTPTTYPSYALIRMGPECIHRVGFNTTDSTIINRTFLKITISRQVFNRQGNQHNSLFDYNWPMVPRSDTKRNHSNIVFEPTLDPQVEYKFWNGETILTNFQECVRFAIKRSIVEASPAIPGELLQTDDGEFATTVNQAKLGDWKITTKIKSQYFLPGAIFEKFYIPLGDGAFQSKLERVAVLLLDENIKILAPWGRVQYLRSGDFLVKRNEKDIYGVLKKDFEASYKIDEL